MVLKGCRWQICRLCHDDSWHFGVEKTLLRISDDFLFAKMRQFINKYIKPCLQCNYYKPTMENANSFSSLHADHIEPFYTSMKRNKYLLVLVDCLSKFVILKPVKDISAKKKVIRPLTDLMYFFGAPHSIGALHLQ